MATMRLVPSEINNAAGTNYLTISNESNAYTNTDSTTYATVQNTNASTSNRYVYLRGFNFDDVPANANVSSFTIKYKASETGGSTSSSYRPRICDGTTTLTGSSTAISTSATVLSFTKVTDSWETIKGYGSDFGIRINCRRNSRNTAATFSIYGAEIEVTYTVPEPRTITTTLTGSGTIDPSGSATMYDGDEYSLTIIPTDPLANVSATKNGVDITSDLIAVVPGTFSISKTAESFTTGYSTTGISFYTSTNTAGNNFSYAVGHTAESPGSTASGSGSWTYVKTTGGSSTTGTGYADFEFDFSEIPSDATINSVTVKCYGAVEDSSQTTSHSDITLYSGSTQKGTMQKFTSSTNSIITISAPGTWTAEELHEAKLRFAVGYYGGHLFGITWTVSYTTTHAEYVYGYTVDGDAVIAVVIGDAPPMVLYKKVNGSWVAIATAYKKVNGVWTQIAVNQAFDSQHNYKDGGTV